MFSTPLGHFDTVFNDDIEHHKKTYRIPRNGDIYTTPTFFTYEIARSFDKNCREASNNIIFFDVFLRFRRTGKLQTSSSFEGVEHSWFFRLGTNEFQVRNKKRDSSVMLFRKPYW